MQLLGAERVGRDQRDEGRVDPAGEPHERVLEAVLARVVAHPELECRVDLVEVVQRLGDARRAATELPQQEVVGELAGAGDNGPGGVHDEAAAVEDELVLGSDQVAEGDRHAVGAGAVGEHRLSLGALATQVRGARWVDDELGAGLGLEGGRRAGLPDVLADREPHAHARDVDQLRLRARLEVADLVEHAVVGQPVLAVDGLDHTVAQHGQGVVDRPASGRVGQPVRPLARGRLGEPDQRRDARGVAREPLERLDVRLGEVMLEIKVLGRVTG